MQGRRNRQCAARWPLARVTLDKGRADGLYLGMEVRVGPTLSDSGRLTIDKLDEHTAEAAFQAFTTAGKPATSARNWSGHPHFRRDRERRRWRKRKAP